MLVPEKTHKWLASYMADNGRSPLSPKEEEVYTVLASATLLGFCPRLANTEIIKRRGCKGNITKVLTYLESVGLIKNVYNQEDENDLTHIGWSVLTPDANTVEPSLSPIQPAIIDFIQTLEDNTTNKDFPPKPIEVVSEDDLLRTLNQLNVIIDRQTSLETQVRDLARQNETLRDKVRSMEKDISTQGTNITCVDAMLSDRIQDVTNHFEVVITDMKEAFVTCVAQHSHGFLGTVKINLKKLGGKK